MAQRCVSDAAGLARNCRRIARPIVALLALASHIGTIQAADGWLEQRRFEQRVEALKREVLAMDHPRHMAQLDERYPEAQRLDVYIRVGYEGFVLESAELDFGDDLRREREYSMREARAFLEGGMHRVLRARVEPGTYGLRARLSGYVAGAEDEPVELDFTLAFVKRAERAEIILPLGERRRVVTSSERGASVPISIEYYDPVAEVPRVRHADDVRTADDDPRMAAALFLLESGRALEALYELETVRAHQPAWQSPELALLLARTCVRLGMRDTAAGLLDRLAEGGTPPEVWIAAQLELAELEYERGLAVPAGERLTQHLHEVPESLLPRWEDLRARTLMAQGSFRAAVLILRAVPRRAATPYMRYNLGVSLLHSGDDEAGVQQLLRLGGAAARTEPELPLHDRAMLVAAQHLLDSGQHAAARRALREVRIQGPYSNPALLAMGWAQLIDRDITSVQAGAPAESASPMRAALRTWQSLAERDPMDPTVQEALVGIPYLLQLMGQGQDAHAAYQHAIETLEAARVLMDEGIRSLHNDRLIDTFAGTGRARDFGRDWHADGLPDMPATYWITAHLAGHPFQEGLRNIRDLRFLLRRLEQLDAQAGTELRTPAILQQETRVALAEQVRRTREDALAQLEARRAILDEHLVRARLGAARSMERAVLR